MDLELWDLYGPNETIPTLNQSSMMCSIVILLLDQFSHIEHHASNSPIQSMSCIYPNVLHIMRSYLLMSWWATKWMRRIPTFYKNVT